jgi:signal transduction histidine kinase
MQKKIILAILFTVIVISVSLGVISYIAVQESIDHALQHKLQLSVIVAKNIDLLLSSSVQRLYDISLSGTVSLADDNWKPELAALKKAFDYSIFSNGIFILDLDGNVVYTYPLQSPQHAGLSHLPKLRRVIDEGRPFISDIHTVKPSNKKTIYIIVPLKNKYGVIEGAVGGEIDPSALSFNEIIRSFPAEKNAYMEIVDSQGIVVASSDAKRMFKDQSEGHTQFLGKLILEKKATITKCHRCHTDDFAASSKINRTVDIMAYAPLETAAWGVSIIQPQRDIEAPIAHMKRSFLMVSFAAFAVALIIAAGMSRSIVRPVHDLIDATVKIAEGDMSKAIAFGGKDEIGMLGSSFEVMRVKLADSLEQLHNYNLELEKKVRDRTWQISNNRKKIQDLLKKVITSQEEERKRIAREFHDSIMQDLSAALIKVDVCRQYPESITEEKMNYIRNIIEKTIDEIYKIIKNLRPTILDDLGFEAALRWLLDKHLETKGIKCHVNISHELNNLDLDPLVKIELFRIIQEAIVNVSRHAGAENVYLTIELKENTLFIDVKDDGRGFDPGFRASEQDTARGLGLMGMEERTAFLGGTLEVCSVPGEGTRVNLKVPLENEVNENV